MRVPEVGHYLFVLILGLSGCDGQPTRSLPVAPSPLPPPGPPAAPPPNGVLVFTDTDGSTTSDVHDAQEQIVQFTSAGEVIWTADGTRFPGYWIDGRIQRDIGADVVFATKEGQRRAYLIFSVDYHHYEPPPIVVDLEVVEGHLVIIGGNPPVRLPGS